MDVVEISDAQLSAIMGRPEGHFSDFKSKRIRATSLAKSLVAFANADGGELFFGIEDTEKAGGVSDGFNSPEDANGHIQHFDKIFHLGSGVKYTFLHNNSQNGYVLNIEVLKSRSIVSDVDGAVYVRRGPRTQKISSQDDLDRIKFNKGINSYEDHRVNVPLSLIEDSGHIKKFMLDSALDREPRQWLCKQLLIDEGLPVVAGLILFSEEPQIALSKAAVKIYRYKTIEAEGTRDTLAADPETIEGNAYDQIYNSVDRVREITSRIPVVGAAGMESVEFPRVALHEVIANAVLHRDYSIDDAVHVRIFDNRIEIESPGVLPGHVTTRNILSTRSIRNNKIVRIINKFKNPPNKDVGEGLNTTFQAMKELKLKSPEIYQSESSVLVVLRHERLGSAEEMVIAYLREHLEINNSIARNLCAIGDANKMKRIFQDMVEGGVIEPIEGRSKRYAAYRKGANFPK